MISIKVTCAIISYKGETLVTQRGKNMSLPLKWEFPGGKIEPNESDIDCIKREIREELNIEIEVITKLESSFFDYPNKSIELIPFITIYKSGEIILKEHEQYLLLDKADLVNLDWAEADIPILKQYMKL